ncbi:MAG: ROK family protein [Lewinellaceae bacterium]|nr:ROK family protein [Saprospiraceae bacterium]MCB9338173.1 ROK family protein [Lewinellaceae bacterium]
MTPIWGIDLGGTKIEGVVIENAETMNVLKRMRLPTEQEKGYSHILKQIYRLIETMMAEVGVKPAKIGIGTPGTLDPILKTLKNSNTVCLNGMPFKKDLEDLLGIPLTMANDANCFALAEARLGAAREEFPEAEVVWGIIMGTGVGSGIVVNGKLITGRHGIGGEWGHTFLDESGGKCYCGKTGCTERVISGPALAAYYNEMTGRNLKLPQIVELYEEGDDEAAQATMERLVYFFGKAVGNIINVIDPEVIVLGGGLGNIDLLYTEGVHEVKKHIFNNRLETVFLKPKLGDSAGVFGAALLSAG